MEITVYFQDFKEEAAREIADIIAEKLKDDVEALVKFGLDREIAISEIVSNYLKKRNFGWKIDI